MNDSERGSLEAQDHTAICGGGEELSPPTSPFAADIKWRWIQVFAAALLALGVAGAYAVSRLPSATSH